MIRIKYINGSGVIKALNLLQQRIGVPSGEKISAMAEFLQGEAMTLIIPNIKRRFGVSGKNYEHTRSDWRKDESLGFPRKDYAPGGVDKISDAIHMSKPVKTGYSIYFGIGNMKELSKAAKLSESEDSGYDLFSILEWGTGVFSSYPRSQEKHGKVPVSRNVIIRTSGEGKYPQVYPFRGMEGQLPEDAQGRAGGIATIQTRNPGTVGRNAFLNMDGAFYGEDLMLLAKVGTYIVQACFDLSYKGKR